MASGGPNNNDEIAVRGGDNEETMSGKDTEYPVGRERERGRERQGREGASGSGQGRKGTVGDSWKDTGFRRVEGRQDRGLNSAREYRGASPFSESKA